MERKEGRVSRNLYKGHVDKTKRGRSKGGRWGWLGWGGVEGGTWSQLYLNNNKKKYSEKKCGGDRIRMLAI